jgi:Mrp family chromosome partitioning ATPase
VSGLAMDQLLANRAQVITHGPSVVSAARDLADMVIVEAPPLLRAHDALGLLPAVDVVLVVAEFGVTTFDNAKKAGALLRRYEAPVLGTVLSNVRPKAAEAEMVPQLLVPMTPMPPAVLHPDAPTAEFRR